MADSGAGWAWDQFSGNAPTLSCLSWTTYLAQRVWEGCQGASSQAGWALLSLLLYAKSCPTLGNPMDGSLPGSSVHGIFQDMNIGVGCYVFFSFSPSLVLFLFLSFF